MVERILILSNGRTGSHLLLNSFRQLNVMTAKVGADNGCDNINQLMKDFPNFDLAIHAHQLTREVRTNSSNLHLVLNLRRDLFMQAVSHIVASRSGNYCTYSNKIKKTDIKYNELIGWVRLLHKQNCNLINKVNLLDWKSSRIFYYEDFFPDPEVFIKKEFALTGPAWYNNNPLSARRPYEYSKIIRNFKNLEREYYRFINCNEYLLKYPSLK